MLEALLMDNLKAVENNILLILAEYIMENSETIK